MTTVYIQVCLWGCLSSGCFECRRRHTPASLKIDIITTYTKVFQKHDRDFFVLQTSFLISIFITANYKCY